MLWQRVTNSYLTSKSVSDRSVVSPLSGMRVQLCEALNSPEAQFDDSYHWQAFTFNTQHVLWVTTFPTCSSAACKSISIVRCARSVSDLVWKGAQRSQCSDLSGLGERPTLAGTTKKIPIAFPASSRASSCVQSTVTLLHTCGCELSV